MKRSLRRTSATGSGRPLLTGETPSQTGAVSRPRDAADYDIRPRSGVYPVRTPAAGRPGRVVVDAAVISKWFVSEPHSEAARRIVDGSFEVVVPDLVFSDLGTILQHRVTSDEMSDAEALAVLQVVAKMPLQVHRTWPLGPIALELQRSLACGVYDCIHIALALRETAVFVTANRSLYDKLRSTALARHVRWIADIPVNTAS